MKLGIFGLNMKAAMKPDVTVRLARRCEELGYESWWAGEHVVLPSPRVPPAPMEPDDACLDPLVHLAHVAAVTSTESNWPPGSSSCRSATRSCSPSRSPRSTGSAAAGSTSVSGSATSSRSSMRSE